MKVSKSWLKGLVDLSKPLDEVIRLLPLRTIAIKEFADDYFELDMKGYNRADLLSMRGVSYEVAAITDSTVNFHESEDKDFTWSKQNLPELKVEVKNTTLCPFYAVAKIEGLKVSQSDDKWIKKLTDSGMRPVNNIADITNLVMLEYGQPLHAFDKGKVSREEIIVRTAKSSEKIVTLDNNERDLTKTDLLITDPQKALGIAGVMGGKNSEVTESTDTILLEAAIFDPVNLRKTATRLNLPSEASKRFQHGLTKKRLLQALNAAIKTYQDLGGKLTAISFVGDYPQVPVCINLSLDTLNSLVGVDISSQFVEESLAKLYFTVKKVMPGKWEVIPPYFRLDVLEEADVIEEVARLYGYEKIPSQPLIGKFPAPYDQKLFNFIYDLKKKLSEIGLTEVVTYSFYSTAVLENFNISKKSLIKVGNPMSHETEYMRNDLWPNLLKVAAENLKTRDNLAIFEIGKVYLAQKNTLPKEEDRLSIALSSSTTVSIEELYFIFLKMAEDMNLQFRVACPEHFDCAQCKFVEGFHPTRYVNIYKENKKNGFIAEVHPKIVDKFGTDKRIAVLEVDIAEL